jgi:hypothetical protein
MIGFSRAGWAASIALTAAVIAAPLTVAWGQPAHPGAVRSFTVPWSGGDRLFVAIGADVRYVQGPVGKVVITGPDHAISDIVVDHGVIRHDRRSWGWEWWKGWSWDGWRGERDVHVVVTAPHLEKAAVSGSGHLDLGRLSQDRIDLGVSGSGALDVSGQFKTLRLSVSGSGAARLGQVNVGDMSAGLSGSGQIKAAGAASTLHLGVSGSGVADMGALAVQDVDAHLSGSGSARLAPKRSADLGVSGSGTIRLLSRPPQLNSHRSGSGAILLPDGGRA